MYKVLVVDDEAIIRKGLVSFIDWDAMDCEIAGEMQDGIEALEAIALSQPDIVISDIKMPGLSGIELAKSIHEKFPKVKVILLTGYADFTYAQAAIKYDVVDFVLKPTSKQDIFNAVTKAKGLIKTENEKDHKIKLLEKKIDQATPVVQEKLVFDILKGVVTDPQVMSAKLSSLGMVIDSYFIIISELTKKSGKDTDAPPEGIGFDKITSLKKLTSVTFKNFNYFNTVLDDKTFVTLITFKDDTSVEYPQQIFQACKEMIALSESFSEYDISIGISSTYLDLLDIAEAYSEAKKAFTDCIGNGCRIGIYTPCESSVSQEKQSNFLIDKSLNYIKNHYCSNITLQDIADYVHINSSYLSRLFKKETGQTITDVITQLRIEKAKELLAMPNIRAYEVASMVGFENSTYFSYIFKKYTGLNPKEFKYMKK